MSTSAGPPEEGNEVRAVLHVINGLEIGGAETVLAQIVIAEKRRGDRVLVVAIRGGGAIEDRLREANVPVVYLQRHRGSPDSKAGLLSVMRSCAEFSPNMIVGWMYHGALIAQLIAKCAAPTAPVVWTFRCTLDDRPSWPLATRSIIRLLRLVSRMPTKILYNSAQGRAQHEKEGFHPAHALVIENGVDTNKFRPDLKFRSDVRKELGLGEDVFVFGHVARYHKMKGQHHFLDAVSLAEFNRPSCLIMVGPGVDGNNKQLTDQIKGLAGRCEVRLLGERHDISRLLNAFDVFCLTSTSEGFPNAVVEAMATEVYCVVSDAGDSAHIVGECGEVVPVGDVGALANAMSRSEQMPDDSRKALAAKAREKTIAKFSDRRMLADYEHLFDELRGR